MDEKVLEILIEMNNELKNLKLDMEELKNLKIDMKELKTEMHNRFDKVEAKLDGVGGQFELTNESRMDDFDWRKTFIS